MLHTEVSQVVDMKRDRVDRACRGPIALTFYSLMTYVLYLAIAAAVALLFHQLYGVLRAQGTTATALASHPSRQI
jgi:hypothetical protein